MYRPFVLRLEELVAKEVEKIGWADWAEDEKKTKAIHYYLEELAELIFNDYKDRLNIK